ncbi:septum formation family protein [Solwaraspora sp. WMMB762]|uniref:septum formation family protein n=1 Tax=Solwaraspora sp. WMMB762 TaxID=3404120 RepID=UPI003B947B5A
MTRQLPVPRPPLLTRMVALLAAASLAVTAGCAAPPPGTDGTLTDGWAGFGEPTIFVPQAGTCHRDEAASGSGRYYRPVDCDELHLVETVHVGTFTGADAQRTTAPVGNVPARETARVECDARAAEFLGDIWQHGLLDMTVLMPPQAAWSAGARWFRCDLIEISSVFRGTVLPRTGSLRGTLADGGALRLGCHVVRWGDDHLEALEPVDCARPHHGEFVGAFDGGALPSSWPGDEAIQESCLLMIADYADLPVDEDLPYRVATFWFRTGNPSVWEGDLRVRCFLYVPDFTTPLVRSAKGGGPDLFPVW